MDPKQRKWIRVEAQKQNSPFFTQQMKYKTT